MSDDSTRLGVRPAAPHRTHRLELAPFSIAAAGRSMIDALERIDEPSAARAAWHEALRDNPVSSSAIWAAVRAEGGQRRAHHFGVLLADLQSAERLLGHDAAQATSRGPGARILSKTCSIARSRFFCAPNGFLEALPREPLFTLVFEEACAYLRRRSGGRDVHGRLLVDAVVAQLIAKWLVLPRGMSPEQAPAQTLRDHLAVLTTYAFTPFPDDALERDADARGAAVRALLSVPLDGPLPRWWIAAQGAATDAGLRALLIDTLCELCAPATEATLAILHEWLESGVLWLESSELRRRPSREHREVLVHSVRAASADAPTPVLLPIRASRDNPLGLAEDSLVVIGCGAVLAEARALGRAPLFPWLPRDRSVGTPHEHFAAAVLGAVLCCRGMVRTGPLQLRFDAVDAPPTGSSAPPARARYFFWKRG